METRQKAVAELYAGTELGWPVMVVVACLLAFNQAMSVITQEPKAMLYTIDSLIFVISLPFYALTIRVSPATIKWHLLFGLFPKTLPVASIQAIRTVPVSPIDGYGVRGDGGKKFWRVSGSNAVVIELVDDGIVAFGVADPQPLVTALERARNLEKKI